MSKEPKNGRFTFLFLIIGFLIIFLKFNTYLAFAQESKQDKCDKLADCLQTFYKECYNEEFLNKFFAENDSSI